MNITTRYNEMNFELEGAGFDAPVDDGGAVIFDRVWLVAPNDKKIKIEFDRDTFYEWLEDDIDYSDELGQQLILDMADDCGPEKIDAPVDCRWPV